MSDTPGIVVYGARGHGREVALLARAVLSAEQTGGFIAGFVDDDPELLGTEVGGLSVLGNGAWLLENAAYSAQSPVLLGVGSPHVKRRLRERLQATSASYPAMIHPSAEVGERVSIGQGSLVSAGVIMTCDVRLAEFCTLNLSASVSHDSQLGSFVTLAPGARLAGNVKVGEGADIGMNASVLQGRTIGSWSVVGAGAVVTRDVPPNTVVAGVPAKEIRRLEGGWHQR